MQRTPTAQTVDKTPERNAQSDKDEQGERVAEGDDNIDQQCRDSGAQRRELRTPSSLAKHESEVDTRLQGQDGGESSEQAPLDRPKVYGKDDAPPGEVAHVSQDWFVNYLRGLGVTTPPPPNQAGYWRLIPKDQLHNISSLASTLSQHRSHLSSSPSPHHQNLSVSGGQNRRERRRAERSEKKQMPSVARSSSRKESSNTPRSVQTRKQHQRQEKGQSEVCEVDLSSSKVPSSQRTAERSSDAMTSSSFLKNEAETETMFRDISSRKEQCSSRNQESLPASEPSDTVEGEAVEDPEMMLAKERKRAKRARDKQRQKEKARLAKCQTKNQSFQNLHHCEQMTKEGRGENSKRSTLNSDVWDVEGKAEELEEELVRQLFTTEQADEVPTITKSSPEGEDSSNEEYRVPQPGRHGCQSAPVTPALPFVSEGFSTLTTPDLSYIPHFPSLNESVTELKEHEDPSLPQHPSPTSPMASMKRSASEENSRDPASCIGHLVEPGKDRSRIMRSSSMPNATILLEKGINTLKLDSSPRSTPTISNEASSSPYLSEQGRSPNVDTSNTIPDSITEGEPDISGGKHAICEREVSPEDNQARTASNDQEQIHLSQSETSTTSPEEDIYDDSVGPIYNAADQYRLAMLKLAPILQNNLDTIIAIYKAGKRLVTVENFLVEILDEQGHCQIVSPQYHPHHRSRSQDYGMVSDDEEEDDDDEGEEVGSSGAGSTESYDSTEPLGHGMHHPNTSWVTEMTNLRSIPSHTSIESGPGAEQGKYALSRVRDKPLFEGFVNEWRETESCKGRSLSSYNREKMPGSSAFANNHDCDNAIRPSKLSPALQRAKARLREKGIIADGYSREQATRAHQTGSFDKLKQGVSSIELGPLTISRDHIEGSLLIYQHHQATLQARANGGTGVVDAPRSERRKAQAAARSESRWMSIKKREIIKSKRPMRPAEQAEDGTITIEEAPLRAYAGSEHRRLPRPMMARNLLSRQFGVRIGNESEWAKRETRLAISSSHLERQLLPHHHRHLFQRQSQQQMQLNGREHHEDVASAVEWQQQPQQQSRLFSLEDANGGNANQSNLAGPNKTLTAATHES